MRVYAFPPCCIALSAHAAPHSGEGRRRALLKKLALPEHLTANGLLEALNVLCSYEEFMGL